MSPIPPKNSAAIAKKASGAGTCIIPVKNPIVPANPNPPNQPNIFCAPCAKKTTPSTSLRIDVAVLSSVAYSRRIILSPPCVKRIVFGPQRATYLDIKIDAYQRVRIQQIRSAMI